MRRWWYRRVLTVLVALATVVGTGLGIEQLEAMEENKRVSTGNLESDRVIPGGMPIGIYMKTDGILVLATDTIECVDGSECEPAKNLVKSGDYIVEINGEEVETKSELVRAVNHLESADVVLGIRREDEVIDVKVECAEVSRDKYKLGIWVKDSLQGLGTVTYLTANSKFGALGHGIHDSDTDELLEISDGTVYETNIVGVQKGKRGEPGGLEGVIIYNRYNRLGTITENTENGIYGTIADTDALFDEKQAVEVCKKEDIKLGDAVIRCALDGEVKEYDIEIKNVDFYTGEVNKGIIIEVVDQELLALTGGIVQGMSGSPIIQDGKIVGAVTHVLVNDPARGYGIFIEEMLEAVN